MRQPKIHRAEGFDSVKTNSLFAQVHTRQRAYQAIPFHRSRELNQNFVISRGLIFR